MIAPPKDPASQRLDYLDAARAFALLLGVVFHASISFSPIFLAWAVQDVSTSPAVLVFLHVSHSFRMELFFLLAGFFSRGLLQRLSPGGFLRSRLVRLGVPFVVGWFLLRPLLVSGWVMGAASLRGDYDFWAGVLAGFASFGRFPDGLLAGTHLWFLYYLILITALVLAVRLVLQPVARTLPRFLTRLDATVAWLARSGWAMPVFVLATAAALWGMKQWGMDTPDKTLRPHWPVLAVYGGFFGLGWLFARQPDAITAFGRVTATRVLLALVGIVLTLGLSRIQGDPSHPHFLAARAVFAVGYATMMWTLVALTLGIFRRFCSHPRPVIRYLADSSYWMYLIHLPVVVWLQVAVAEVALPWQLKLAVISVATIGIALLTYALFVRSTFVGAILNGRRKSRWGLNQA